jgi:hypothetical protein
MERFKAMTPPSFKGESQPLVAESWMREMEKLFRAIKCDEEDKVRLASYMLQVMRRLEAIYECCLNDWWILMVAFNFRIVQMFGGLLFYARSLRMMIRRLHGWSL